MSCPGRLVWKSVISYFSSWPTAAAIIELTSSTWVNATFWLPSPGIGIVTSDLVVEKIEGNPEDLVNTTLYQDENENINRAQGTITNVEKIRRESKDYYVISLDSDYDKDIQPSGSVYGKFQIHPKTRVVSSIISGSTTLEVDSTVAFPNSNAVI